MLATCQGCRTAVDLDLRTGHTRSADGETGKLEFTDRSIVIWYCPACEYPHADRAA